jgi:outer membrane lipoprotein SlyB
MKKLIAIACAAFALTGCATQSFIVSGDSTAAPTQKSAQSFFISGIGQTRTLDAAAICGGSAKVMKVESQQSFLNGLLGVVTMGIYTPRDAKVYCAN